MNRILKIAAMSGLAAVASAMILTSCEHQATAPQELFAQMGDDDCPDSVYEEVIQLQRRTHGDDDQPAKVDRPPTVTCLIDGAPHCKEMYRRGYDSVTKCVDPCGNTWYELEFEVAEGVVTHDCLSPNGSCP